MAGCTDRKRLKSAFDSTTFDADISVYVEKDINDIGSATISPCGRDVAIASKTGLEIIDLDSPLNPPRVLRYGQSWLVADVQWSPFAARENWVASASNHKTLIWNLTLSDDLRHGAVEHTLDAHSRAITDINFSAHHPDIISTCAVDGFVHCWDLRRARKPVMTFCDWDAGATQVKWNRQDPHIIASSHDRWLRIWDDRKGAYPLRSINAHESKIYGLDWNRTQASRIVTCSLDKSVKVWDYTNDEDVPERIIQTAFPVWRARHTPFGYGLLAMPQNEPGNLHLYDLRNDATHTGVSTSATAVFPGHGDKQVKEFLWRTRGNVTELGADEREFQLVSWGTDNHLRLQHLDSRALASVGYTKGDNARHNLNVTRKGAAYKTFRHTETPDSEKDESRSSKPHSALTGLSSNAINDSAKKMSVPSRPRHNYGSRATVPQGSGRRNQIGWMSGIKFTSPTPEETSGYRRSAARRLSLIRPSFDSGDGLEVVESLHDEIIRVHEQYSKVSFDEVNMDKRYVAVSMTGPWGDNTDPVFLKVNIRFPNHYPDTRPPTFTVGRSSLISDAVHERMLKEVQQVASGFVGKKRGCLEAALCYFLGEVDLEESSLWFAENNDVDDIDALAEESSSEDENDMPPGTSALMSQELDTGVTGQTLTTSLKQVNVPLPRLCGACFASNGLLVCFFPPKEEKIKSLLGTLSLGKERSKGDPSFDNFSRLKNEASMTRSRFSSLAEGEGESSDSDQSTLSSSDSDSSQFQVGVAYDFWRKIRPGFRRAISANRSQKSSTAGTGTGVSTVHGRNRTIKPNNTISICDLTGIMPAKRELAGGYAIFGAGSEVCNHNADIAEALGYQDRADIWRYAGMLLEHQVPLEIAERSYRKEPILVIARDMIRRCRRDSGSDSGIDLSFDCSTTRGISGRVKWGHSPIAGQLIDELFQHFERLADIQMLAMLSCVFSETTTENVSIEGRLTQPETPLSMKMPAFSLDYFPSNRAVWSAHSTTPYHSSGSTPRSSQTPTGFYGSLGSSGGVWGGDPITTSHSAGTTPPKNYSRFDSEKLRPVSQSLSTSPEDTRAFRRGNSGLSSFAGSLARFSATTASAPPSRKRPSPIEQVLGLAPTIVSGGSNTLLDSMKEQRNPQQIPASHKAIAIGSDLPIVTGINTTAFNHNLFDDEGCLGIPLLATSHVPPFAAYRAAYATLLFAWNLPLPRLEILKFSGMSDYDAAQASQLIKSSAASVTTVGEQTIRCPDVSPALSVLRDGKGTALLDVPECRGIDVAGYCLKHDSRLESAPCTGETRVGGATGRCGRCNLVKRQLRCVICTEPVTGTYTPCLSCGCVTHAECMNAYLLDMLEAGPTDNLSKNSDREGTDTGMRCPGGCECECIVNAGNGIVEDWEVMIGVLARNPGSISSHNTSHLPGHHTTSSFDSNYSDAGGDWDSLDETSVRGDARRETAGNASSSRSSTPTPLLRAIGLSSGSMNASTSASVPNTATAAAAVGAGYQALGRRLGQVRTGEWTGLRRKGSALKKEEGAS